jgi:hypothetical protein
LTQSSGILQQKNRPDIPGSENTRRTPGGVYSMQQPHPGNNRIGRSLGHDRLRLAQPSRTIMVQLSV